LDTKNVELYNDKVNSLNLRKKLFLKRKLMRAAGFNPKTFTSLDRLERRTDVNFEKICEYSPSFTLEIQDPRNGRIQGHYFQNRDVNILKDIIIEPTQGFVYSNQGNLIQESTTWPNLHAYNSYPWRPTGRTRFLNVEQGISVSSSPFYHWLVEDLPATLFALKLNLDSPIIAPSNSPNYVLDFLSTTKREVIFVDGPVRVKSIISVEKRKDSGWPHPVDLQVLRNYEDFADCLIERDSDLKIYISRRNARRSPKNEAAIEDLFKSRNYQVVYLEEMSLFEQIETISKCTSLAGVHGAGLTHSIWMQPGAQVIDIVNSSYWTECYHRAAHISNLHYKSFEYEGEFKDSVPLHALAEYL